MLAGAGIDIDRLNRDLATNAKAIDAMIARNNDQATAFGFKGTPSFIVGKFRVPGILTMEQFGQVIADARKAAANNSRAGIEMRALARTTAPVFKRKSGNHFDDSLIQSSCARSLIMFQSAAATSQLTMVRSALRDFAAGDRRGRHRIGDVDARDQQQRTQDHPQKNAHGKTSIDR